jgi:hypothetical protein
MNFEGGEREEKKTIDAKPGGLWLHVPPPRGDNTKTIQTPPCKAALNH